MDHVDPSECLPSGVMSDHWSEIFSVPVFFLLKVFRRSFSLAKQQSVSCAVQILKLLKENLWFEILDCINIIYLTSCKQKNNCYYCYCKLCLHSTLLTKMHYVYPWGQANILIKHLQSWFLKHFKIGLGYKTILIGIQ